MQRLEQGRRAAARAEDDRSYVRWTNPLRPQAVPAEVLFLQGEVSDFAGLLEVVTAAHKLNKEDWWPTLVMMSMDYGLNKYTTDTSAATAKAYGDVMEKLEAGIPSTKDYTVGFHLNEEQLQAALNGIPREKYPYRQLVTCQSSGNYNPVSNGWFQSCLYYLFIYVSASGGAPSRYKHFWWPDGAERHPVRHHFLAVAV